MVDLLVLSSSDQLPSILKKYSLYKTSYPNEEVNCTEPSPSVGVPWYETFCHFRSGQITLAICSKEAFSVWSNIRK